MPDNPKGLDLKPTHLEKFRIIVSKLLKPVSIIVVQFDPDGCASALLVQAILETLGVEAAVFYGGNIDRTQNQVIFNNFDLKDKIKPLTELPGQGSIILVDSSKIQDPRFGVPIAAERIDIAIDHHQENQVSCRTDKDRWVWIAPVGAATTLVWRLWAELNKETPVKVDETMATMAALGVYSDTDKLRSSRTTSADRQAWCEAMEMGGQELFEKCSAYLLPKRCQLLLQKTLERSVDIGPYRIAHPNCLLHDDEGGQIAALADDIHRYEEVSATIVWGIVNNQIRFSVRMRSSESMNDLIADLFGKGAGGGKHNASGGGIVPIPASFLPTDDLSDNLIKYIESLLISKLKKRTGAPKEPVAPAETK